MRSEQESIVVGWCMRSTLEQNPQHEPRYQPAEVIVCGTNLRSFKQPHKKTENAKPPKTIISNQEKMRIGLSLSK
jgi:hypothetical protein